MAEYLIHELADRASVTVRTIRYYTEIGLLPEPIIRGKFATYTDNHLERLRLIQQLKTLHLPLSEIREKVLSSASDEEIRDRLIENQADLNESIPEEPDQPGSQALEYLSRIRNFQRKLGLAETQPPALAGTSPAPKRAAAPPIFPKPAPAPSQSAAVESEIEALMDRRQLDFDISLLPKEGGASEDFTIGETWQKTILVPGVELMVRLPVDDDRSNQIIRLVDFARQIFQVNDTAADQKGDHS